MTTIDQIEKAVLSLSPAELAEFRAWFSELEQASGDADSSRPAEMIRSSIKQHERGESRDGFQALDELKQQIADRFGS